MSHFARATAPNQAGFNSDPRLVPVNERTKGERVGEREMRQSKIDEGERERERTGERQRKDHSDVGRRGRGKVCGDGEPLSPSPPSLPPSSPLSPALSFSLPSLALGARVGRGDLAYPLVLLARALVLLSTSPGRTRARPPLFVVITRRRVPRE